ncbi:MAG: Gfo/Idh/MocA family oxidoreductase [Phycisphaerae bacterium]|nr:Gfo/Idh/MocA family oxidoreductase [Phycisphaerae bacterium]
MNKETNLNRRSFLRKSTVAIATALAAPTIVPSSVLGANSPSNRINLGMIGMGLMMGGHYNSMLGRSDVQVLAVCDVDRNRRDSNAAKGNAKYAQKYGKGKYNAIEAYLEYEKVCARNDIDAVFVITPDHWHAMCSLEAIKAGKDVYCQKPMTLTIKEGRLMSDACKQYNSIFQVGSQQRSEWAFRKACELVRNGYIGKVHTIYAHLGSFAPPATLEAQPIPDGFDYDRWLGPTPWYPFNAERVKGNYGGGWRRFWEYGSRKNGDWGAHHFDIIQWALGMDNSGPVKFVPKGYKGNQYQTHYYADGCKVLRDHPDSKGHMIRFIGSDGEVMCSRGGRIDTTPTELARTVLLPSETHLYESSQHESNWLECVRTRKQPICDAEIGHRTATICHLSGIAERLGRPIHWDPAEEKILDDPTASRWIDRPRRAPYIL